MKAPHQDADHTRADSNLQVFDPLDAATEAALRASILKHGVLVPVAVDQDDRVLDGHHRSRIALELDVPFATITHWVTGDEHALEIARTLNEDRRQLPIEQRREVVADLREQGHSERAIAGAVGVGRTTVQRDLARGPGGPPEQVSTRVDMVPMGTVPTPERVKGLDGKSYPAAKPKPVLSEDEQAEQDHLERCERVTYSYATAASTLHALTLGGDASHLREHWMPSKNPLAGLPIGHLVTSEGVRELGRFLIDVANDISDNTDQAALPWA